MRAVIEGDSEVASPVLPLVGIWEVAGSCSISWDAVLAWYIAVF